MRMLRSVKTALKQLEGSYINCNNEIILIPKYNVYVSLDTVETDEDFLVKLCEWFSRDCCCALRYSQDKRLKKYWQQNTDVFNSICGTSFKIDEMETIYTYLGNSLNRELAKQFVQSKFDLSLLISN